ncbi:bacteriocin [Breoghania sp.]|uniref:bacteriocin n=1 Tax=Breoghania sp. TaxID=2065378 RepID=UPI002AA635E1|nr:bacteriocin [Breoghania sp.]
MRTCVNFLVILAVAGSLAGCGSTPTQRAVSGAGLGTAAGVGVAVVAGTPLLTGAAIGAAAGAVAGAITNECQIDLGPRRPKNC